MVGILTAFFLFANAHAAEIRFPAISNTNWIVPSKNLPPGVEAYSSNNNVAIQLFHDRLYMAWRSAPTHFASNKTRLYVVSSLDLGKSWKFETSINLENDVREPTLITLNNKLILHFVELGHNPRDFEPKHVWQMSKEANGTWSSMQKAKGLEDETIPWEVKVRDGKAWMTAYRGNSYGAGESKIEVYFKKSSDGLDWQDVNPAHPVVYKGGVTEVAWEFDDKGDLWGITRNEDGDSSGFGSQFISASANNLATWEFPKKSDSFRYDSPRMLQYAGEIYLIARRNVSYLGDATEDLEEIPYDRGWNFLPWTLRKFAYLGIYSIHPKRTSVFKLDRASRKLVWLKDLPSTADTAFASIVPMGKGKFLVANYSNPIIVDAAQGIDTRRWPWIRGQLSSDYGTQIYLTELDFSNERKTSSNN